MIVLKWSSDPGCSIIWIDEELNDEYYDASRYISIEFFWLQINFIKKKIAAYSKRGNSI